MWYGAERAFVEGLRGDSLMLGSIRVSQLLSILLVVAAAAVYVYMLVKIHRNQDPEKIWIYADTPESERNLADMEEERQEEKEKARKRREARHGRQLSSEEVQQAAQEEFGVTLPAEEETDVSHSPEDAEDSSQGSQETSEPESMEEKKEEETHGTDH